MQRRACLGHMAAGVALGSSLPLWAQGRPQEGKHFVRLGTPQPMAGAQPEVLEFFWYGCPTCFALEPALNAWLARKSAGVSFKRAHAFLRPVMQPHQQIFYALEAMGMEERLHAKVFDALQVQHLDLRELADIQRFIGQQGLDADKFTQVYQSFSVQARCQQAKAQMAKYDCNGVPWLCVNGRYATSPAQAGGMAQTMQVVDYLLTLPRG